MRKNIRRRFWVDIALASITGVLAVITPVFPDWIELVSGWDPDRHGGSAEQLVVTGLCLVTMLTLVLAATEWRRTAALPALACGTSPSAPLPPR